MKKIKSIEPVEYDDLPERLRTFMFYNHHHLDTTRGDIVYLEEDVLRIIAWMKDGNYK